LTEKIKSTATEPKINKIYLGDAKKLNNRELIKYLMNIYNRNTEIQLSKNQLAVDIQEHNKIEIKELRAGRVKIFDKKRAELDGKLKSLETEQKQIQDKYLAYITEFESRTGVRFEGRNAFSIMDATITCIMQLTETNSENEKTKEAI